MKYGDYLGTAISQHMTSKYLTKSLTHLLQARIVEVIMYDCPVLVSSARSSISKPLIEIHIFESLPTFLLEGAWVDNDLPPSPPPKQSGNCKQILTSCHIWDYFAIL